MFSQTTTGPCSLIADDDDSVREGFRWILQDQNRTIEASGVGEALPVIHRERPDLVTSDIRVPEKNRLEMLRLVRERSEDLPIVMITGIGSIDAAGLLRSRASDYLERHCGYDQSRTSDNRVGIAVAQLTDFIQNDPFNRTNRLPRGPRLFVADWMVHNHGGELQLFTQEGTLEQPPS